MLLRICYTLFLSYVSPNAKVTSVVKFVGIFQWMYIIYIIWMLYIYIYAINSTEKFIENYDEIAGIIVGNGRSVRCNIKTYVKYRKSITLVTFVERKKFLFEFCYGFVTRSQSLRAKKNISRSCYNTQYAYLSDAAM